MCLKANKPENVDKSDEESTPARPDNNRKISAKRLPPDKRKRGGKRNRDIHSCKSKDGSGEKWTIKEVKRDKSRRKGQELEGEKTKGFPYLFPK